MRRKFDDMNLEKEVIEGFPFDGEYEFYEVEKDEDFMVESIESRKKIIELREKGTEMFFDDVEIISMERLQKEKYYQYSLDTYDKCTEE